MDIHQIRKLQIGSVTLPNNLILGPMAGVTDLPFRLLCKEQGAGLLCMEMVSAKAILYKNKNTESLLSIDEREKPVSLQMFGSDPQIMAQIAKQIEERPFDIPVWNGLTNEFHPTQMIADMLTIREHLGRLGGVKFVYMGDARYNMGNSLMVTCAKLGMDFVACTNKKYFPNDELVKYCKDVAETIGASITLTEDVAEGTKDADVIYTDVWVSMGEPQEVWAERINDLKPYQVNAKAFENAKDSAIFMHCLPAFHDLKTTIGKQVYEKFGLSELEVTDEVFESERSVVFDEAENRMHSIKAIMRATLAD